MRKGAPVYRSNYLSLDDVHILTAPISVPELARAGRLATKEDCVLAHLVDVGKTPPISASTPMGEWRESTSLIASIARSIISDFKREDASDRRRDSSDSLEVASFRVSRDGAPLLAQPSGVTLTKLSSSSGLYILRFGVIDSVGILLTSGKSAGVELWKSDGSKKISARIGGLETSKSGQTATVKFRASPPLRAPKGSARLTFPFEIEIDFRAEKLAPLRAPEARAERLLATARAILEDPEKFSPDYSETSVVCASINGIFVEDALTRVDAHGARTTALPIPGDGNARARFMVLEHFHSKTKCSSCEDGSSASCSETNAKLLLELQTPSGAASAAPKAPTSDGLPNGATPRCLGLGSASCGGWEMRIVEVPLGENLEKQSPKTTYLDEGAVFFQTYGPAPGQIQMRFSGSSEDGEKFIILVTFRAPRAGPVLDWTCRHFGDSSLGEPGQLLREYAEQIFFPREFPGAHTHAARFSLDLIFGFEIAELEDLCLTTLKTAQTRDSVDPLSALRALAIAHIGEGRTPHLHPDAELRFVSKREDLFATLRNSGGSVNDFMCGMSPRVEIANSLLRKAAGAKDSAEARKLRALADAVSQYSGRFAPAELAASPELDVPEVHSAVKSVFSGSDEEEGTEARLAYYLPSFSRKRIEELYASGVKSLKDLSRVELNEHEMLALAYSDSLSKYLSVASLTERWTRAFSAVFRSPPESVGDDVIDRGSGAQWSIPIRGHHTDSTLLREVPVAVLASAETGGPSAVAKYVRAALGAAYVGDFAPPEAVSVLLGKAEEEETPFAEVHSLLVRETGSGEVRAVRLFAVGQKRAWVFFLAWMLLDPAEWETVQATALREQRIDISPDGIFDADSGAVIPSDVIRSIAAVFALGGGAPRRFRRDWDANLAPAAVPIGKILGAVRAASTDVVSRGASSRTALEIEARIEGVTEKMFFRFLSKMQSASNSHARVESVVKYFDTRSRETGAVRLEIGSDGSRIAVAKKGFGTWLDPVRGARFAVSTERTLSPGEPGAPRESDATLERKRTRWSFTDGTDVRIDLTIVRAVALEAGGARREMYTSHEIEMEISDPRKWASLNSAISRTFHTIHDSPLYYDIHLRDSVFEWFNFRVLDIAKRFPMRAMQPDARTAARRLFGGAGFIRGETRMPLTPSAAVWLDEHPLVVNMPGQVAIDGFIARPRNLKRRDLTANGIGGEGTISSYSVALKADGTTSFLVVDANGVWLIAPPGDASLVISRDSLPPLIRQRFDRERPLFGDAIAVGEDVPASNQTPVRRASARFFAPFDLVCIPKAYPSLRSRLLASLPGGQKLPLLSEQIIMNNYLARYDVAATFAAWAASFDPMSLYISRKTVAQIEPGSGPEGIAAAIRELRGDTEFRSDGYIFTPDRVPPAPFGAAKPPPAAQRMLSQHPDVCKLKPWDELTVDLRVSFVTDPPSVSVSADAPRGQRRGPSEVPFVPFPRFDSSRNVQWDHPLLTNAPEGAIVEFGPTLSGADPIDASAASLDERYAADGDEDAIKSTNIFSTAQERAFLSSPPNGFAEEDIVLVPRRIRIDKSFPNAASVVANVWEDIAKPLDLATVAGSANFQLLFQQNNALKRKIFSAVFSDRSDHPAIVVDLGSGMGGDIAKYREYMRTGAILAVVAVEPNPTNYAELLRRLDLGPYRARFFPVMAPAEDTQAVIMALSEAVKVVSRERKDASPIRVLVNMMLSLSFFFRDTATLESLGRTLRAIDSTARRSGVTRAATRFVFFTIVGQPTSALFDERGDDIRLGPARMVRMKNTSQEAGAPPHKIWIDIQGTIVRDQTEYFVDMSLLRQWVAVERTHSSLIENFLSSDEKLFGSLFEWGTARIIPESSAPSVPQIAFTNFNVEKLSARRSASLTKSGPTADEESVDNASPLRRRRS